jgi:hypothetical protein
MAVQLQIPEAVLPSLSVLLIFLALFTFSNFPPLNLYFFYNQEK